MISFSIAWSNVTYKDKTHRIILGPEEKGGLPSLKVYVDSKY